MKFFPCLVLPTRVEVSIAFFTKSMICQDVRAATSACRNVKAEGLRSSGRSDHLVGENVAANKLNARSPAYEAVCVTAGFTEAGRRCCVELHI